MTALTSLSIKEASDGLKKKQFTAKELVNASLTAVENAKHLNAFIVSTPEIALKQAAEADARIAKGEARLLDGIPIGVKDLFCTKGTLTTAASHLVLENFGRFQTAI